MWVTSRSHYGLIALAELARSYGQGPVPLSEITRSQHLPMPYLERLVMPLRKAGLVRGSRGQHGGYELIQPPEKVTVSQVVRALDGDFAPVECVANDYESGSCVREQQCTSRFVWERLKETVNEVLDSITLADLCQEPEENLRKVNSLMRLTRN
jgi:Rrf2 family cysteine metabolism transcriptional repressor